MLRRRAVLALAVSVLAAATPAVRAVLPPAPVGQGGPLANVDVRPTGREASPTKAQLSALDVLRAECAALPGAPGDGRPPEIVARWGWQEGTLHHVFRRGGFLSGPAAPGADPEAVARTFALRHRTLAGLSAEGVDALELVRRIVDPGTAAVHLSFRQRAEGLPVFHGSLRVHLDRDGRVLSLAGDTVRDEILSRDEALDASAALVAAARSVGVTLEAAPDAAKAGTALDVAKEEIQFARGPFESEPWAHLRWFPLEAVAAAGAIPASPGGLVKAWVVVVDPRDDPGWYQVVVDARTGEILSRHDLVDYIATEGLAFREDPGQGPQIVLPFVDDTEFTDPASPFGWSATGLTEGNNVDSKDDRANDNEGTIGRRATATPGPPQAFAFPFTDNTTNDLDAALTNAFYLNNWLHDKTVRLGFDEASGNFQETNYSGEGRGTDRVRVDVQDGGGTNNANFGTPPDGRNPRMQMYIWTYTNPRRDSSYDASVVTHELFHGVSNRLVGLLANDAGCLGGPQGGAMGEAWSDFYACTFWNQDTVGGYLVNNYVRGIRRAAYTAYPYDYGQLCNQGGFEVHRDGEIWTGVLWRLRELFIARYGYQRGKCVVERLVLDGMKLSPCLPTYVDMRDAILLAAQLHGVDGDACLLWQGFAERGLGIAAVPQSGCTTAADASYVAPPECAGCATFAAPSSVVIDSSQPNRVIASFVPSAGATGHVLLRAPAPCPGDCLEASFIEVARGPGDATSLMDTDQPDRALSVGDRFAYRVVALQGACTAATPCTEVRISGRCTLRPTEVVLGDAGVASLTRPPGATCSIQVEWHAAQASCPPLDALRYNVYRSEDPAFVPGPEHLVASVPEPARNWLDASVPVVAVTYVVRAEDMTVGGEGPHGGNEEGNDSRLTLVAQGAATGTTDFADDAEAGELPGYRRTGTFPINDWAIVSDGVTRGGSAWHTEDVEGGNADKNLHLPLLTLGAAPRLRFLHAFELENDYDGGVIEISTDAGRTWIDLIDDIVAGGYTGPTLTVEDLIHPPNVDRLWTGQNQSGYPNFDLVDVDLAPYAGTLDAQIRFRLLVDSNATLPGGWYVDDIVVEDTVTFGACATSCTSPPVARLADVLACTDASAPVVIALDGTASTAGLPGFAAELPFVFTHDGPGSFAGRRWAEGPIAALTFPAGSPAGDHVVSLTVRGADGCANVASATVRLRDETIVPTPVGDSLRITKAGTGIALDWAPMGAPSHNIHLAALGDDLAGMATTAPFANVVGSPALLDTGLAAQGAGTAFIQVYSASDCGRSVP